MNKKKSVKINRTNKSVGAANNTRNLRLIHTALIAFGYEGKDLEREYERAKSRNMTINQLMDEFIDKIDRDPNAINKHNCPYGKCIACGLLTRKH
jgi:hypothetical protein